MVVLVNNAGFGSAPNERLVSEDGHEFRFQVNYLSTFLLTHMLMPRLRSVSYTHLTLPTILLV